MLNTTKNRKHALLDSEPLSATLERLGKSDPNSKTAIHELLNNFHENGIVLSMIIFSLPAVVPLPPGFASIIGMPLILLSMQLLLGYDKVKLPAKINNYQLNNSILVTLAKKVVPPLRRIEGYIKPRFGFAKSVYCEQFIGFVSLICAIAVIIPLPLTNVGPAFSIAIMCIGLLNRDGVVIILGVVAAIIALIVASGPILASIIGVKYLWHLVF